MSKSKYLILLNSLWFYHKKTSIKNTNIHIHFHYIYIFSFFSFYIHICTLQIIKIQKPNKQYIEQLEIYKINPKKFKKKKCWAALWGCKNVVARLLHAPPPLAACGFTHHRKKIQASRGVWNDVLPSSLPRRRWPAKH